MDMSYVDTFKDVAFPGAYLLLALFYGVSFLVCTSILVHIYAVPVFGENMAGVIGRHPTPAYAVGTILFAVFTAAGVGKWVEEK